MLKGIAASQGIAIAKVYKLEPPVLSITKKEAVVEEELNKLDAAYSKTVADIERIKEIDEQYNKCMNDKDFQGKFDYILYNNYDSESEKQILDLVKNLIVNE